MDDKKFISHILSKVRRKKVSLKEASRLLAGFPSESLRFARIDTARGARCGFPEVIYCEGKTVAQIRRIAKQMLSRKRFVLMTRLDARRYSQVKKTFPKLKYNRLGRIAYYTKKRGDTKKRRPVLVVTGGTSDIPVAEEARATLEVMGNRAIPLYDVGVAGMHRLLNNIGLFQDVEVVIAIAGMEGALASVVGGLVSKPVIAVPTSCGYGANFKGIAPLLTMLNSCAPGVAVVNIDNGFGAAYLANMINPARGRGGGWS